MLVDLNIIGDRKDFEHSKDILSSPLDGHTYNAMACKAYRISSPSCGSLWLSHPLTAIWGFGQVIKVRCYPKGCLWGLTYYNSENG